MIRAPRLTVDITPAFVPRTPIALPEPETQWCDPDIYARYGVLMSRANANRIRLAEAASLTEVRA